MQQDQTQAGSQRLSDEELDQVAGGEDTPPPDDDDPGPQGPLDP